MSASNVVKVNILGQEYVIRTSADPAYIKEVAAYMNEKMDELIDSGIDVSLATDFNPGSCTINSIPIIMSLAVLYCGLTIKEAFKGVTWNAAKSLKRDTTHGIRFIHMVHCRLTLCTTRTSPRGHGGRRRQKIYR